MRDKAPGPVRRKVVYKVLNVSQLCLLLGGAALFLSGCTTHSRFRPATVPPAPSLTTNVIALTPDELRRAEDHAYDSGFEAGRAYERQHLSHRPPAAAPPVPATTKLQPTPPPQPLLPPQPSPSAQLPATPSHTGHPPPAPAAPVYSPSGPASPLSPPSLP